MIRRYAEMRPEELAAALAEKPLAICPWGALEWHGAHLPLGLDGLVAEAFSERLAEATGGVLLPGTWLPITTLPHAHSISIPTAAVCAVWRALFDELARVGVKTICVVTGHYAQGHELELYRECREALKRHDDLRVLAGSPLEMLLAPELLDHAGRKEAAQLLALRPELVRLDLFEEGGPRVNAVLGEDPREATAEEGERLLADGLAAWLSALELWDRWTVWEFYGKRMKEYRPYREEFYRESWEQAIRDWWAARSGDR
jgi:creatinine amidohydrolase